MIAKAACVSLCDKRVHAVHMHIFRPFQNKSILSWHQSDTEINKTCTAKWTI